MIDRFAYSATQGQRQLDRMYCSLFILPQLLIFTILALFGSGGAIFWKLWHQPFSFLQLMFPQQVSVDKNTPPRTASQTVEKRSHADQDHYNALPDLLDRFQIGELVIPSGFVNEQNPGASLLLDQVRARAIPVRTIAAPITWGQAGTHFTALHPPVNWHPEASDNARSLVLDAEYEGRHLLLTGDLDQLGLSELVFGPQPDPSIELMFSPHHGGKSANPSWLYSWARPRTVVVSQRPPAPGTTDALTPLERAGTPVLRTWQCGAIHFQWTPDGIITQGFLDLNGCRSLPAWPTGEGASSWRVFAMLLSSPWVLHDAAGRIVISLAGFLLGVIASRCWQSSSTAPGPWSCRPGRGLRRRTCSRRMRNRQ